MSCVFFGNNSWRNIFNYYSITRQILCQELLESQSKVYESNIFVINFQILQLKTLSMRTSLLSIRLLFASLFVLVTGVYQSQVVISQAYGGGGNSGAEYTHDFVELFNRGEEAVNIEGWSIQYSSATGTGSWSNHTVLPNFLLEPGQYYLVQHAQGNGGTLALPAPDLVAASPITMSGTAFKILLANDAVILSGANPTSSSIMDLVGFGAATAFEGTVAPALTNTTAGIRLENGCQDTNDNAADFQVAAPTPRNSTSPFNVCAAVEVESVAVATSGGVNAEIIVDNGTLQLIATVTPAEANQNVVWSIEVGEEFASVSAAGLVSAIDNGTVTVRATSVSDNTIYDEIDVVISNQVEDIVVTVTTENGVAAEITTEAGTLQLVGTVTPNDASQEVTWSIVSGSVIASVDAEGLVTAESNGTVVVRATSVEDDSAYGEISIIITNQPVPVASISVTTQGGISATIATDGGTLQLVATVLPAEAEQGVEWSVESGNSFVSVNAAGLVMAIANGSAVVRATSVEDNSVFGEITVTVAIPEPSCDPVTTFLETFNDFESYPEECWAGSHGAMYIGLDTDGNSPAVQIYSFTSANDSFYMVSPPVSTINGNYVLEFNVIEVNGAGSTIQVGSLSEQDSYGDFAPVAAAFTPVSGTTYTTTPLAAVSGHQYVAIKFVPNGVHKAIIIDNVEWKLNTVGVSEIEEVKVNVYPNPSNGIVNITSDERVLEVSIFNALGQCVLTENTQRQFDLTAFDNGIYTVKIKTQNGIAVKRVVKK